MTKIGLWWKFEGRYYHKDFYHGVRNLIRWFKVIWRDRDYDHGYIFDILKTKLKNQSQYISKHDNHLSAKRDAQIMMTCVRLIDKIQDQFYDSEYTDYHHSEYLWIPLEDGTDYSRLEINELSEKFDEYFAKYKHAYREVTKSDKYIFENDSKIKIAMNMGRYLSDKADRILFSLMERNIKKWWD